MRILLVRHPETTKNTSMRFAGRDSDDVVTPRGMRQIEDISLLARETALVAQTFGPSSSRSRQLVTAIAGSTANSPIWIDGLSSIDGGDISGMLESDVKRVFPEYYYSLDLYRKGVLSSYDLNHTGESLHDFEARIDSALTEIEDADCDIAFVVGHKSALTAGLIRFARRFHGYPEKFFGFVDLPTGSVSGVDLAARSIEFVGLSATAERVADFAAGISFSWLRPR